MTLMISIPPEAEAHLQMLARAAGTDLSEYVSNLVLKAAKRKSLDEILAPLRKEVAASSLTDEQILQEVLAARDDYRAEKRKIQP